jgi:hypothetical protein
MSSEAERLGLRRGCRTFLPVAARRIEFAAVVRQRLLALRPACVAVELPHHGRNALLEALERLPRISVLAGRGRIPMEEDEEIEYPELHAVIEPGDALTEACRTALEMGAELALIGAGNKPLHKREEFYPDPAALSGIPYECYAEMYLRQPPPPSPFGAGGWEAAARLEQLDPGKETAVVLRLSSFVEMLPLMGVPLRAAFDSAEESLRAALVSPSSLGDITEDCPWLQERYEEWRAALAADQRGVVPDRRRWLSELWQEAEENYRAIYGGVLAPWQKREASRFLKRLVRAASLVAPSLFDLVAAARGVVDDNLAYEVWRLGTSYSHQRLEESEEGLELQAWEVFPRTRRLRLRQRYELEKRRLAPRAWKRRPGRAPELWAAQLGGEAICSYPPEDIVIEDFGRSLRQRAVTLLGEERARVEPFATSLLDGIDLRETVRRWHEGRIYVRETEKLTGEAGAVVVVFDEDPDNRYSWLTTWLGENSNESDMAFYSTPPFENLVGPGIGRAEYGGFLMTTPPGRMADVWTDPDYDQAETKPERLLLAAIDYSLERRVVYVAARPPRARMRQIAAMLNRQILFIPLGALSPEKLRKIRVLHVLDSHQRRRIASRYIW